MDSALLIVIIGTVLALALFRPAPRTRTIYVPVDITEERGGLGCLPLLVVVMVVVVLLVSGVVR